MTYSIGLLANTLAQFLQIYLVLMIIRVLLSWFPNINWYDPPFSILSQLTDPYLNLFRSIIPPLGGIDFSPMIAFFVLQFGSQILIGLLGSLQTAF
ncbi:MAG: YggT family protein [Microcoleus sp. PH2017_10_PVI_O_A]|uniref:YggT family protein n=1 Tax=unclassified Microcoleus TaxID=2642155 RepID=UPI001D615987|nr:MULTISPECIES: YggT family protein [unclassified Microcoleus]TAE83770.1 MAG: YggT family protein [Oscillatoriales cyanobacterium]MCC3405972.1 YggT family protein [Microcoleus sp. PH2017_10_PVI_O_A]MCC3459937.1 YggT family protein [Microcoleus sp. PH2017_11_PCY_U_A]MCC3478452.1 YggT family protein [Microcoleus sp. PH2017_12_PCY_D_A]MCC3527912.1 YggT family protein [Microcoleus sp. PH2017_21_RUC_O_A]